MILGAVANGRTPSMTSFSEAIDATNAAHKVVTDLLVTASASLATEQATTSRLTAEAGVASTALVSEKATTAKLKAEAVVAGTDKAALVVRVDGLLAQLAKALADLAACQDDQEQTPGTVFGASVGADGWPAVARYETKIGKPAAIRTYAAGGLNVMAKSGAVKYPGVPQVYGPAVIASKLTDAQVITALRELDVIRAASTGGKLWLCPNPEHDRHIAKDHAYTMVQYTSMMAQWYRVAKANVPTMVDCLWTNPTGYQASARFATYVTPVLPYIAGIGVDGYTFAKETGATQASTTDMTWASNYAKANGKRFGMFEQGVEAGPNQARQLASMLTVVEATKPDVFIYWETQMSDGSLDCKLSPESAALITAAQAADRPKGT